MSIALDTSASGSSGPNAAPPQSLTVAHTLGGGANRAVVVVASVESTAANAALTCTYNGVAMTNAVEINTGTSSDQRTAIFYLLDASLPAAGTYNVVLSEGGTQTIFEMMLVCYSFTGVNQSGQPDATASATSTTGAASYSNNITTVAANAWVITGLGDGNLAGAGVTATNGSQANVTTVNQNAPFQSSLMASTLATTTAGVYSTGFQGLSPNYNRVAYAALSIAEAGGSTPISDGDTGTAVDAGESIQATVTDIDVGTATDDATVAAGNSDGDTGTAVDSASIAVQLGDGDTGTAVDAITITVLIADTDTATATDTLTLATATGERGCLDLAVADTASITAAVADTASITAAASAVGSIGFTVEDC